MTRLLNCAYLRCFIVAASVILAMGSAAPKAQEAPVKGACGTSNGKDLLNPPVDLCSKGTASALSGSGPWSWSCAGGNGGAIASCSASIAPVNGACGNSNGRDLLNPPVNLCIKGAASAVSGSGPWNWSCAGSNGGTIASCSASLAPVNGVCGNSNGKILSKPPVNLCIKGTASPVSGSGPWSWTCAGINSGSTASCSTSLPAIPISFTISGQTVSPSLVYPGQTINIGATVTANQTTATSYIIELSVQPQGTNNFFNTGYNTTFTSTSVNEATAYTIPANAPTGTYTCSADVYSSDWSTHYARSSASFTVASSTVNGQCGASNNAALATAPASGLCTAGTASSVTGSGPWSWSCAGSTGGSTASCSASSASVETTPSSVEDPGPSLNLYNHPYYNCVNNYYVSTTGSDSNPGTQAQPWATLQHANDSLPAGGVAAGTCINVAPGTYSQGVWVTNGGNLASSTGYVVYRCTQMDGCTVTGSANGGQNGSFSWGGSSQPISGSYVMVDGFTMTSGNPGNIYGQGVQVWDSEPGTEQDNSVHHIWILNSIVSNYGQSGLQMNDGEYFYAIHNTIYNNSNTGCSAQGSGISFAFLKAISGYSRSSDDAGTPMLSAPLGSFNNAVMWNVLYNNATTTCGTPGNPYDSDGNNIIMDTLNNHFNTRGVYPGTVLIAFNVTYNAGGRGIHLFLSENVTVANNSCYNTALDPSDNATYRPCIGNNGGYSNNFFNNIAYAIQTNPTNSAQCSYGSGQTASCLIYNSAFTGGVTSGQKTNSFTNNVSFCEDDTNISGSHNYGCNAMFNGDAFSCSTNQCNANPLWSNVGATSTGTQTSPPTGANFALQQGSPAIGHGLTASYLPASSVDAGACSSSLTTCP